MSEEKQRMVTSKGSSALDFLVSITIINSGNDDTIGTETCVTTH